MKFSSLVALSCAMALVVTTSVTAGGVSSGQTVCCTKTVYGVTTCYDGWTGSGAAPDGIKGGDVAECNAIGANKKIGYVCSKTGYTPTCVPYTPPPTKPFCCKTYATSYGVTYQTCAANLGGTAYIVNNVPTGSDVDKCKKAKGTVVLDATCKKAPYSNVATCVPDTVSGGQGDPHITALDGRSYLLWGKDAATYNLLSERTHSVNIRLYTPATMKDGHALYIDAVGILIRSAKIAVRLVNPAEHVKGSPAPAPASLELAINEGPGLTYPGHPIDRAVDAYTSYSMRNPNKITITSRDLVLSVVLMENFYLDVLVDEVAAHWSNVHGILGQTHASAFKLRYNYARGTAVGELPGDAISKGKGQKYDIKGKEEDYITSGLLKTDDKFTRFEPTAAEEANTQVKTRKLAGAREAVSVREHVHAGVF